MVPPAEFLAHHLPETGAYFALALRDGRARAACADTQAELLVISRRQSSSPGADLYFALAAFDGRRRLAAKARALRSLFLDIDVGEGKPYAGAADALRALAEFVSRLGLPRPTVVASGGGLHVYWRLPCTLGLDAWRDAAERLKAACLTYGLHADPNVTADAARILRLPGTLNYKFDPPQPVRVVGNRLGEELDPDRLPPLPQARGQVTDDDMSGAFDWPHAPVDAARVADRCAAFGLIRETRGRVPEPAWRAGLGLLKHCVGGEALAHDWSLGDPRYRPEETQGKYDRWRGGPPTCSTMADGLVGMRDAHPCNTCPHRGVIKSPIVLGREEAAVSVPAAVGRVCPDGFRLDPDGVRFVYSEKGKPVAVRISDRPFWVEEVRTREGADEMRIAFESGANGRREIILPMEAMGAGETRRVLARKGLRIKAAHGAELEDYLSRSCTILEDWERNKVLYETFGWKEDGKFVVGARAYSAETMIDATAMADAGHRAKLLTPRGTLEAWSGAAAKLFRPGLEFQAATLAASAAAPLMHFADPNEGGAVLSLFSRGTGEGKTFALAAAQSFWGTVRCLELSAHDTANARWQALGCAAHLPMFLDELAFREATAAREFLEQFTSGKERARLTKDARAGVQHSWQTILVTTSNRPLPELIAAAGGSSAMCARVFQIEARLDNSVRGPAGEAVKTVMLDNAGTAGHLYAAFLAARGTDRIREDVREALAKLQGKFGALPAERFNLRLIACVSVALRYLRETGIIAIDTSPVLRYLLGTMLAERDASIEVNSDGDAGNTDDETALGQYLNANISRILRVEIDRQGGCSMLNPNINEIVGRLETFRDGKSPRLYLEVKPMRTWLAARDYSWRGMHTTLSHSGALVDTRRVILTRSTPLPGAQVYCSVFDLEKTGLSLVPPITEDGVTPPIAATVPPRSSR